MVVDAKSGTTGAGRSLICFVGIGQPNPIPIRSIVPVPERFDLHQRSARRNVRVRRNEHLAHAATHGRGQRGLHLHALGHGQHVAGVDLVAR